MPVSHKIKYVKTAEENGCVVASLAMLVGKDFYTVLNEMKCHWNTEGQFEGVADDAWMQYLAKSGYAIQDIDHDYSPEDRLIETWPLKPFAPIHMCFVYAEGPHAIVLDKKGKVYDPNDPLITKLSEYHRVYRMVGVWKVGKPLKI